MSMDQLSNPPSTSWPVQTNELFQTLDHQACYGQHQSEHAGLTWGYYGGRWGGFSVADGTHTLTNAANNYIVVLRSNGVPSVSTSNTNWNDAANYARVYKVTTAGGVVTAIEDHRAGPGGVHGQIDPSAGVVDADEVGIADSGAYYTGTDVEAALQEIGASLAGLGGLVDVLVFAGVIDCSANPNYPAADAGAVYVVSVAGKIGGGSGPNVEAGDTLICRVDSSASGNHATVGANWTILQRNIDGAVTGPASAVTDSNFVQWDGTSGRLAKQVTNSAARAQLGEKVQALTDGGTISVDASLANNFRVTLGGNRTLANPTNLIDGQVINIRVTQDGTGSRTLSYGSKYKWPSGTAPTLSTAAGSKDFISCQYDATDDTLFCVCNKAFS